jgi:hypothetical protein
LFLGLLPTPSYMETAPFANFPPTCIHYLGGLDWAGGRICGIIYKDGPGEGQTDRGLARRLDDPASLVVGHIPRLAQHLYNLTGQRMVGADDAYISHILCPIGGLLLRTSRYDIQIHLDMGLVAVMTTTLLPARSSLLRSEGIHATAAQRVNPPVSG